MDLDGIEDITLATGVGETAIDMVTTTDTITAITMVTLMANILIPTMIIDNQETWFMVEEEQGQAWLPPDRIARIRDQQEPELM